MSIPNKNKMSKRMSQSLLSLILSALMLTLSGCDNGDDRSSDGGTGVVPVAENVPATETSGDLNGYLTTAIHDEYRARDTYIAVMTKLGQVQPFVNIKQAEEQHIAMLANLFNNYGLPVPADTVGGLPAPDTLAEACSVGVQAEIENGNLYNDLLAGTVDYPDVQAVFRQLQAASLEQHLPAFQRCAN